MRDKRSQEWTHTMTTALLFAAAIVALASSAFGAPVEYILHQNVPLAVQGLGGWTGGILWCHDVDGERAVPVINSLPQKGHLQVVGSSGVRNLTETDLPFSLGIVQTTPDGVLVATDQLSRGAIASYTGGYNAQGTDTFSYFCRGADGDGRVSFVHIALRDRPDAPVATFVDVADLQAGGAAVEFFIRGNDSDADGVVVSATVETVPDTVLVCADENCASAYAQGDVISFANNSARLYAKAPHADAGIHSFLETIATEQFGFRVTDNTGLRSPLAVVSLPIANPIVATSTIVTMKEDAVVFVNLVSQCNTGVCIISTLPPIGRVFRASALESIGDEILPSQLPVTIYAGIVFVPEPDTHSSTLSQRGSQPWVAAAYYARFNFSAINDYGLRSAHAWLQIWVDPQNDPIALACVTPVDCAGAAVATGTDPAIGTTFSMSLADVDSASVFPNPEFYRLRVEPDDGNVYSVSLVNRAVMDNTNVYRIAGNGYIDAAFDVIAPYAEIHKMLSDGFRLYTPSPRLEATTMSVHVRVTDHHFVHNSSTSTVPAPLPGFTTATVDFAFSLPKDDAGTMPTWIWGVVSVGILSIVTGMIGTTLYIRRRHTMSRKPL
jgi:hypothetical protein